MLLLLPLGDWGSSVVLGGNARHGSVFDMSPPPSKEEDFECSCAFFLLAPPPPWLW